MKNGVVRGALVAAIATAIIIILTYLLKETSVLSIISRTDPKLLIGGAAVEVLGLFLYALSWHVLVITSGIRVRLRKSVEITWSSLFLLYITPAGALMDVSRALLMGKEGKNTSASAASVIIQRVLYAFAYAIITTTSIFMIYFTDRTRFHLIYPFIIFVLITIAAGLFILLASRHKSLVGWATNHVFSIYYRFVKKAKNVNKKIEEEAERSTNEFSEAISDMFRSPSGALASLIIIVFRLLLAALVSFWVFVSLNYFGVNFWEITLVMLVGEFVTSIPIGVPGMLGFVEAAMSLSYVALGVPFSIAIAATLLIRLILYWWDVLVTGLAASIYAGNIKTILHASEPES